MPQGSTRIFDGSHLRADLVRRGGSCLMVTFDYRRLDRDGFGPTVPSQQIAAAGHDHLMIATRANDWFVNPNTQDMEAVFHDLRCDYAHARALGFSMGGFGAFRFSDALRLDHVVAVSPQVSLDPAVVPFERRYRAEARQFDGALGAIPATRGTELSGAILCDPLNPFDLRHARMLQQTFPAVRLVRLPGGGHPASQVLRTANRAGLIQRLALGDGTTPNRLQAVHRVMRAGQAGYWLALARACGSRRADLAAAARAQAAKLGLRNPDGVDADRDSS